MRETGSSKTSVNSRNSVHSKSVRSQGSHRSVAASTTTRRKRKDKWGNRLALIGITLVVLSLALVVTLKGASLRDKDREYQIKEENLNSLVEKEEARAQELEEYKIYVQTKQYVEKVAKEKLGLVNPNEILLKPSENK